MLLTDLNNEQIDKLYDQQLNELVNQTRGGAGIWQNYVADLNKAHMLITDLAAIEDMHFNIESLGIAKNLRDFRYLARFSYAPTHPYFWEAESAFLSVAICRAYLKAMLWVNSQV